MIVLAFVLGYMARDMMKSICGQRIVEGYGECIEDYEYNPVLTCSGATCTGNPYCEDGYNWIRGLTNDELKCKEKNGSGVEVENGVEGTCQ